MKATAMTAGCLLVTLLADACGQSSDPLPSATAAAPPASAGAAFILDQHRSIRTIDERGVVSVVVEHVDEPLRMTTDRDGRLWVAAAGVLTFYGGGGSRSVKLPGDRDDTNAIVPATAGGIWALQNHSLVRVNEALELTLYSPPLYESGEQTRNGTSVDSVPVGLIGKPLDFFLGGLLEADGEVWVACSAGLYRFSPARREWRRVRLGWFSTIVQDTNGMLWTVDNPPMRPFGHWEYLVGWNGASFFEQALPENASAIAAGRDGRVHTLTSETIAHYESLPILRTFTASLDGRITWEAPRELPGLLLGGPFVVDDNERIWAQAKGVRRVIVFDRAGQMLTLPGDGYEIAVARGGPSLPTHN